MPAGMSEHLLRLRGAGAELILVPVQPGAAQEQPDARLQPTAGPLGEADAADTDTDLEPFDAHFDDDPDPLFTPTVRAPSDALPSAEPNIDALLAEFPFDDADVPDIRTTAPGVTDGAAPPAPVSSGNIVDDIMAELSAATAAASASAPAASAQAEAPSTHPAAPPMDDADLDNFLNSSGLFAGGGLASQGISLEDLMEFADMEEPHIEADGSNSTQTSDSALHALRDPPGGGDGLDSQRSAPKKAAKRTAGKKSAGSSARAQLPAAVMRALKARGATVAQVRAAVLRSQRRRDTMAARNKRVRDSFLAGTGQQAGSASAADEPLPPPLMRSSSSCGGGGGGASVAGGSADIDGVDAEHRPEVVHRAPQTSEERLDSLYQALTEARKAWDGKAGLLRMLHRGGGRDDARLATLRRSVRRSRTTCPR